MKLRIFFSLIFILFHYSSLVGTQQAFATVSFQAIQRIIPHATNRNAFALAKALNNNAGKFARMRQIVNQFFNQKKQGNPNPKTLSLFDNSTYSRLKLISLVKNRQAITQMWNKYLTPDLKKIYNAATEKKYKHLFAYFDNREMNSFDSTYVYWLMSIFLKEHDDTTADKLINATTDALDKTLNKSPDLAWILYTEAFEANHNRTLMKGKW